MAGDVVRGPHHAEHAQPRKRHRRSTRSSTSTACRARSTKRSAARSG
jgi:hypothetical protein